MALTTKYDDSEAGARKFITDETIFLFSKDSKVDPDPEVMGVWRVTELEELNHLGKVGREGITVILYMAGYPDPTGENRKTNDFEND